MNAIIVEDELNVRAGFEKMLHTFCPEITIVGTASNVEQGIQLVETTEFDILFLDINLPDGSGFDLLHHLTSKEFHIVFVTAYDKYAIDAFKISATDYLLKPVSPDDLERTISKIKSTRSSIGQEQMKVIKERLQSKYDQSEKIILRDSESLQIVSISDIKYCHAEGRYTTFHMEGNEKFTTSTHLKEYEKMLEPYGYIRTHHSYMVNVYRISSIQKNDGGYILMDDDSRIPLSSRKKGIVVEAITNRFLH